VVTTRRRVAFGSYGGWSAAAAVAPKAAPTAILGNLNAPNKPKVGATAHSRPSGREQEEHLPP